MKHYLKLNKLILCVVFALCMPACVVASQGASIAVNGAAASLKNPVITVDGYNLAPMAEIMIILGAEVQWDGDTKTVTATREDRALVVTIGSYEAYVNGVPVALDIPARINDGVSYIPIGFLGRALDYKVTWRPDSRTVSLDTSDLSMARLDLTFKKRYNTDLNFDEAYARAVSQNKDLKTLKSSMEDLRDARGDLARNFSGSTDYYSTLPESVTATVTASVRGMLQTLETMRYTLENEPYNRQIIEGSIELSVKSSFVSIAKAEMDIAATAANIELSNRAMDINRLSLELGVISQNFYDQQDIAHRQLLAAQETNERALETEYIGLNKLLGYNADRRYNIVIEDEYKPLDKNFLLDSHITRMLGYAPNIRSLENDLKKAESDRHLFVEGSASFSQTITAVNTASLKLEDAKRDMEKNLRTAYNGLRDMETQIKSTELDLEKLAADADAARVVYETGGMRELDLLRLFYAEDATKKGLELLKLSYDLRLFMFNNPYMLG